MSYRYGLEFRPAAVKTLRKLPHDVAKRIRTALEALQEEPRPRGVTALKGRTDLLRIRVAD